MLAIPGQPRSCSRPLAGAATPHTFPRFVLVTATVHTRRSEASRLHACSSQCRSCMPPVRAAATRASRLRCHRPLSPSDALTANESKTPSSAARHGVRRGGAIKLKSKCCAMAGPGDLASFWWDVGGRVAHGGRDDGANGSRGVGARPAIQIKVYPALGAWYQGQRWFWARGGRRGPTSVGWNGSYRMGMRTV